MLAHFWLFLVSWSHLIKLFLSCKTGSKLFLKIFGGHKSFLWGHWTSGNVSSGFQSQSGQPYSSLAEAYVLHVPWDSPLVWHLPPLGGPHGSWAISSTYLQGIGGTWNWERSCHCSQYQIRQARCSTDSVIQAQLVLSFHLVGHVWKLMKNWLQEWAKSNVTFKTLAPTFTYHKSAKGSFHPFPQISWTPQINE